ncbi:alpha,alpha-trehalase TreF [Mangrovimonas sp. DI 80]|uniref:alpha,alpha-trehalase TreF n=1 Tax=Mangrovimonas sp. DI 80 TaxID=1779330 RepID=UPI0009756E5D|nr:alpha,alpha-trehalase TreF [Mangrovimonas sp. DI 80]OMP30526.1 trehalase [Mangrovimonas sp. DI 80]
MRFYIWVLCFLLWSCKTETTSSVLQKELQKTSYKAPSEVLKDLFVDVQLSDVFGDSKTFVDCTAKLPYDSILEMYHREKTTLDFKFGKFVADNFELPKEHQSSFEYDAQNTAKEHIEDLWPYLTHVADTMHGRNSLISLPNAYVVPGGRFREVYYWDSYFTMLGLVESGKFATIEAMLDNFAYLIDVFGHIPNGNRSYYISRSQPPFFSQMIELFASYKGDSVYLKYREALRKEYEFWMAYDNSEKTYKHLVSTEFGLMNRYYDALNKPRDESYKEDYNLKNEGTTDSLFYRHVRAAAESGWDFSSRWLRDASLLNTMNTLEILPVDLNALLYGMETVLIKCFENEDPNFILELKKSQQNRIEFLNTISWNQKLGVFEDYNWLAQQPTGRLSLAMVYPLYFKMVSQEQADAVANVVSTQFLKPGGLVTTNYPTGQQWDAPNGWAPLQWMAVIGLENYGHHDLAKTIMQRWVALNEKVYAATGRFMEKYNVEDLTLEAGGGEYPLQDGFGWSNGVYLAFKQKLEKANHK